MAIIDNLVQVTITEKTIPATTGTPTLGGILIITDEIITDERVRDFTSKVYYSMSGFPWSNTTETYKLASIAFANGVPSVSVILAGADTFNDDIEKGFDARKFDDYFAVFVAPKAPAEEDVSILGISEANKDKHTKILAMAARYDKIYCMNIIGSAEKTIVEGLGNEERIVAYYTEVTANKYVAIEAATKALAKDSGSETWSHIALNSNIAEADNICNSTYDELIKTGNYTMCLPVAGRNVAIGGKTLAGEWADVMRFKSFLVNSIQTALFNLLVDYNKLPYTDDGLLIVQETIEAVLDKCVEIGGVLASYVDEDGTLKSGYSVYVPAYNEISSSERSNRRLPGCKFTARLSGAIHLVEIKGQIDF